MKNVKEAEKYGNWPGHSGVERLFLLESIPFLSVGTICFQHWLSMVIQLYTLYCWGGGQAPDGFYVTDKGTSHFVSEEKMCVESLLVVAAESCFISFVLTPKYCRPQIYCGPQVTPDGLVSSDWYSVGSSIYARSLQNFVRVNKRIYIKTWAHFSEIFRWKLHTFKCSFLRYAFW